MTSNLHPEVTLPENPNRTEIQIDNNTIIIRKLPSQLIPCAGIQFAQIKLSKGVKESVRKG